MFSQGGTINWSVAEVASNDGLIPSNFLTSNQANGSTVTLSATTVTSVQIAIAPFVFQKTSGGWWVAVGTDGNQPKMTIRVYGN